MKQVLAMVIHLFVAASAWAQSPAADVIKTNTFQIVGSQMQAGKWQKRIATLPQGAKVTITATPKETLLQNTKDKQEPSISVRFRSSDRECRCDSRGRWTSEDLAVFQAAELSLTVPKDAALYTASTANARFQLTVVIRQTVTPPPNKAAAGTN